MNQFLLAINIHLSNVEELKLLKKHSKVYNNKSYYEAEYHCRKSSLFASILLLKLSRKTQIYFKKL